MPLYLCQRKLLIRTSSLWKIDPTVNYIHSCTHSHLPRTRGGGLCCWLFSSSTGAVGVNCHVKRPLRKGFSKEGRALLIHVPRMSLPKELAEGLKLQSATHKPANRIVSQAECSEQTDSVRRLLASSMDMDMAALKKSIQRMYSITKSPWCGCQATLEQDPVAPFSLSLPGDLSCVVYVH